MWGYSLGSLFQRMKFVKVVQNKIYSRDIKWSLDDVKRNLFNDDWWSRTIVNRIHQNTEWVYKTSRGICQIVYTHIEGNIEGLWSTCTRATKVWSKICSNSLGLIPLLKPALGSLASQYVWQRQNIWRPHGADWRWPHMESIALTCFVGERLVWTTAGNKIGVLKTLPNSAQWFS